MIDSEKRPVLAGFLALLTVSVVMGVLGGLGVLMGVKVTGIGNDSGGTATAAEPTGLYLPEPPQPTEEESAEATEEPAEPTETPTVNDAITLSSAQASVSPMQQIDLSGTYPAGEGAILQVQRLENGAWADFPVTMSVSGQQFATYVMTSRAGENKFRVVDTDTQKASNEISVTVG